MNGCDLGVAFVGFDMEGLFPACSMNVGQAALFNFGHSSFLYTPPTDSGGFPFRPILEAVANCAPVGSARPCFAGDEDQAEAARDDDHAHGDSHELTPRGTRARNIVGAGQSDEGYMQGRESEDNPHSELEKQELVENLIGMGFPVEWAIRAAGRSGALSRTRDRWSSREEISFLGLGVVVAWSSRLPRQMTHLVTNAGLPRPRCLRGDSHCRHGHERKRRHRVDHRTTGDRKYQNGGRDGQHGHVRGRICRRGLRWNSFGRRNVARTSYSSNILCWPRSPCLGDSEIRRGSIKFWYLASTTARTKRWHISILHTPIHPAETSVLAYQAWVMSVTTTQGKAKKEMPATLRLNSDTHREQRLSSGGLKRVRLALMEGREIADGTTCTSKQTYCCFILKWVGLHVERTSSMARRV